ncbi:MAG: NAD(P)H-dependent oxidoreductase [Deltaproteobacteria bacterium]|nr:NAD(P)H-dependent oxidoreductase [Deltaproteobacteria bacterium]
MRALLLNGSVRGADGDTAVALARARAALTAHGDEVDELVLATCEEDLDAIRARLVAADVFVFGTGTYWSSWGSPLQRFLELATPWEAGPEFVGKPAIALVTMDSVGGVDVAARLLTTLSLLGCCVPPFGTVVLSRTGQAVVDQPGFEDVWRLDDVDVAVANLRALADVRGRFTAWPVERARAVHGVFPRPGRLDLGLPSTLRGR